MLFNTFQFAVFFVLVLAGYRLLPARARNGWLLAASLVFYTLWVPAYLLLLLADIFVNYALQRRMVSSPRPRLYVAASVLFSFGLLAYFKYAAFLVESAAPVLALWHASAPVVPDLLLPIGISFYTFQIVALTVDVYRGTSQPIASLPRYTLFICFFPQLIAGPILRGYEFLPQLEDGGDPGAWRDRRGLWLIASGIWKKVVMADFLLAPFIDRVFDGGTITDGPAHLIAAYAFAFQIYFDFAGYTDMARGMGCLLGFELPLNFREPYLARDPVEFWRRWHMTLSRWLRDYLYIPLGGNRRGIARTYLNLFLTMLLGGMWHGAGWTFALWGGLHGVFLMIHRLVVHRQLDPERAIALGDWWKILGTFHVVAFLLVVFRSRSIQDAWAFGGALLFGDWSVPWPLVPAGAVLLSVALHCAERFARVHLPRAQDLVARTVWGPAAEGLAFGTVVGVAAVVAGAGGQFIYFQF